MAGKTAGGFCHGVMGLLLVALTLSKKIRRKLHEYRNMTLLLEHMQQGQQVHMMLRVAHSVTALLNMLTRVLKYCNDCMYHVNMYCNII